MGSTSSEPSRRARILKKNKTNEDQLQPQNVPEVAPPGDVAEPRQVDETRDGAPEVPEVAKDGVPEGPEATKNDLPRGGPDVVHKDPPPLNPRAVASPSWSCDWRNNIGSCSAIGEYYKAKGMALADYYRRKYDPTYKGSMNVAAPGPPTESVWTDDWQADKKRGISLGEKYKTIGEAIDEHYRKAFDPTYTDSSSSLKGGNKSFDWEADRDRGLAIGQHYKDLGLDISAHYQNGFDFSNASGPGDQLKMTDEQWKEFKKKGKDIGKYYHDKGVAIQKFYQGKYNPENLDADETPDEGLSPNDEEGRGDVQEDPAALIDDMKLKGLAISDYYRAKYDPTYGQEDETSGAESDASSPSLTPPKQDWPPWGQDPEADKAHGKAIGDFYKQRGKEIGHFYKEHGKEIGKYYEDYYRNMFDPTYNQTTDLNW